MISHVSLGVRDLATSTRFYDACLAALGYVRLYASEKVTGYGPRDAGPGEARLDLFRVRPDEPGRLAPPGFHLAFDAPDEGAVDAFHAVAIAVGGTDAGAPGFRARYGPDYYAAFVLDPDGYKLEAKRVAR